jgi:hypothetical protein
VSESSDRSVLRALCRLRFDGRTCVVQIVRSFTRESSAV